MAAVECHIVELRLMPIDGAGNAIDKDAATTTIGTMTRTGGTEPRVVPKASVASSSGSPNITTYVEREALAGFVVWHIGQTYIISYPTGS